MKRGKLISDAYKEVDKSKLYQVKEAIEIILKHYGVDIKSKVIYLRKTKLYIPLDIQEQ